MGRIIYIHVPKCGGSSFGAALRLRYFASQSTISLDQGDTTLMGEARILSDYAARQRALHALVASGNRMIAGHVQYDPDFHDGPAARYRFVTLLREPALRFVSHYHYLQRKHPDPARATTLRGFLVSPEAQRIASQYLFYFAGQWQRPGEDTGPLIQQAIRNLGRFDIVGDLGAPDAFARDLRRLTHTPLIRWHRNAAPVPLTVPPELRPQIEALCAPDIAIYQSQFLAQAA